MGSGQQGLLLSEPQARVSRLVTLSIGTCLLGTKAQNARTLSLGPGTETS